MTIADGQENDWEARVTTVFRFVHTLNQSLYHKAEVPETCLRLWLLAAAAADDCGLEELAYEFFVQVGLCS